MIRRTARILAPFAVTLLSAVSIPAACSKQPDGGTQQVTQTPTPRHGAVIGEKDDEVAQQRPQQGHLGGPFQPPANSIADPQRPTPEPTINKAVDDMTDAELVAYLNTLVWDMSLEHGELVLLPCKKPGGASCPFDQYSKMYIQPEVGANRLDVNNISEKGVVVARLINYSTGQDSVADLEIAPTARGWWYVHKVNNQLRSRYFIRTYASAGDGAKFVGPNRKFEGCPNHPIDTTRPATAKWRSCADDGGVGRILGKAPAKKVASPFNFVSFQADTSGDSTSVLRSPRSETWITCSLGCCVGG
jgi:hypothetical protein